MDTSEQTKQSAAIAALIVAQSIAFIEIARHYPDSRKRLQGALTGYADYYATVHADRDDVEAEVGIVQMVMESFVNALKEPEGGDGK